MLRTVLLPAVLALAGSWLCLPALAFEEADAPPPAPSEMDVPPRPDDAPADEDSAQGDEADEGGGFDFGEQTADDATKTAAGLAAAGGVAMVGFFMVWFVLYFGFIMFIVVFGMVAMVAMLLAIYDCARRDFPDPNTRALWCLVIVLTRWIGALIYYVLVYRKGEPPLQQARPAVTVPQTGG